MAGHRDLQGLCLALADWSAELRIIVQNEERRQAGTRRRGGTHLLVDQSIE